MREKLIVLRARFILKFKTYVRYPLNIAFALVDPLIWITPIYFMSKAFQVNGKLSGFEAYSGTSDYMGFMIIGYIMASYIGTALWNTGFTIKNEMMEGTLEANWTTPASRASFLVGSTIFQFIISTVEIMVVMIICHFTFGFNITGNFMKGIVFLIPCIITLMGFGIGIAGIILLAKQANAIVDVSQGIIMGFSGSYFPIKIFSKPLIFLCYLIPLTFMNDAMRHFMLNQITIIPIKYEVIITIISMFIFYICGRLIFSAIDKKCRINGGFTGH